MMVAWRLVAVELGEAGGTANGLLMEMKRAKDNV